MIEKTNKIPESESLLKASILLWILCILAAVSFLWFDSGDNLFGEYYLLPWCFLASLVVLAPVFYYFYKGNLDIFHPLVFASLSYIFPAFVLGGVILNFGWSEPFYLSFVENPRFELPLSLFYVVLGYVGLSSGYYFPISKKLGELLDERLPREDWKVSSVWIGGFILIFIGFIVNILGFFRGIIGYQVVEAIESYDGLLIFLQILLTEGIILLWLAIFSQRSWIGVIVAPFLLLLIPIRAVVLGSRSGLFSSILLVIFAFFYSGRKLKSYHLIILSFIVAVAIFLGVIYGTTFRNIKGSEARIEAGDYVGQALATIDYLSKSDPAVIFEEGMKALAERVENLSSLAVVVSNYEKLAPYEAAYGLENNIMNDLLYGFIPRFLYPDKPEASNPRVYSDLYFNYGENSFTVTPFGDLLRNFGPLGIPLGMFVLGIYFRIVYSSLVETRYPTMWKKMIYYPLLTVVSYESFYATIFPSVIRVIFVTFLAVLLVQFTTRLFASKSFLESRK
jgi:hypothetical protein